MPLDDRMEPLNDGAVDAVTDIDESPESDEVFRRIGGALGSLISDAVDSCAANWSQSFGVAWYGVFGTAVILAVAGVAAALASRRLSGKRRATIVLLALPALVAVPVLIALIVTLAPWPTSSGQGALRNTWMLSPWNR